ncbi:TetR/AcrR family transcriptional regulator [Actinotalea sp.]|uniref:TetR/AcrR family transcriptional regulator n=1 Tax=Actinotalea sp. TaxID=1872145 RepID=UPI0035652E1F
MPKIVDRDARRREIVAAYLRLAARDGIEQATSRALAAEVGMSTGALWHYFAGFDEVLSGAFRLVYENTNERIDERCRGLRGLQALAVMLGEILPMGDVTHEEALVVVSFWGRVPTNPDLALFEEVVESQWLERMRGHLDEAVADGVLVPHAPLAELTDLLLVVAMGQQVEHVLRSGVAEPSRQWGLVRVCLEPWLSAEGRAAGVLPAGPGPAAARP